MVTGGLGGVTTTGCGAVLPTFGGGCNEGRGVVCCARATTLKRTIAPPTVRVAMFAGFMVSPIGGEITAWYGAGILGSRRGERQLGSGEAMNRLQPVKNRTLAGRDLGRTRSSHSRGREQARRTVRNARRLPEVWSLQLEISALGPRPLPESGHGCGLVARPKSASTRSPCVTTIPSTTWSRTASAPSSCRGEASGPSPLVQVSRRSCQSAASRRSRRPHRRRRRRGRELRSPRRPAQPTRWRRPSRR